MYFYAFYEYKLQPWATQAHSSYPFQKVFNIHEFKI